MADSKTLKCIVVTPEKAVLDAAVDFIAVPMFDGELGVMPGRQALIGRLGYGELRTVQGKKTQRFYVDGGFVQINNNVVTLLTGKAVPAEELKSEAADAMLQQSLQPATTEHAQSEQAKAQLRARAQLRVIRKTREIEASA